MFEWLFTYFSERIAATHLEVDALTRLVQNLITEGEKNMAALDLITAKIAELQAAQVAEQARQVAQDAATSAQIQTLTQLVTSLQAASAAGPTQADLDAAVASLQTVIDSLNAEQPTPPVAPAANTAGN